MIKECKLAFSYDKLLDFMGIETSTRKTMNDEKVIVVVAWHNAEQRDKFCEAWGMNKLDPGVHVLFQQDTSKRGCGWTKQQGVNRAVSLGATIIIVLDDDCLPDWSCPTMLQFITDHLSALQPQEVEMYQAVTNPPSRGTPYYRRTVKMRVAASLGFWSNIPDLCAPSQLVRGPTCSMEFDRRPIYGKAFPYCGMNVAFRVEFLPWANFLDLPRVDDIFAGYLFQREAYRRGFCFNLGGPMVFHQRQSNVWLNLKEEAKYLERNETLWSDILFHPSNDYAELLKLIPRRI